MKYVDLYLRSEYSFLSSTLKIEDIVSTMENNKINTIALADDGFFGCLKFYDQLTKAKFTPIIGARFKIGNDNFIGYVMDKIGYQNLSHLLTVSSQSELTIDLVEKYQKGIIFVLISYESELVFLTKENIKDAAIMKINKYQEAFNNFYVGIDLITENKKAVALSLRDLQKQTAFELIALHKISFLREDLLAFKVLKAIKENDRVELTSEEECEYMLSEGEMLTLFKGFEDSLENTIKLANRITFKFDDRAYKLPKYPQDDVKGFLESLALKGLKIRLKNRNVNMTKYLERLRHELDVINKLGFADYFLIVYDFILYAKKHDILVGPGRGSAPSSLVSYSIGITDIDPLVYGLYFERFLNPERKNLPDIDSDFPDDKRDEVISYIAKRYTKERVAKITTFGTFAVRMAVRDVGKALGLTKTRIEALIKYVPLNAQNLNEAFKENPELLKISKSDDEMRRFFLVLNKIIGLPRHISTHAAGIIIADQKLDVYTPLILNSDNIYQTHFEATDLEKLGLVKIDILGIRNLTIIDKVRRLVNSNLNFTTLPLNDSQTFELVRLQDTDGIFQLESRGMRSVLSKIKTNSFMDIATAIALYRPGPMEMIPEYVARKFGEKPVDIDETLKEVLKETYGIIVYQEQIIKIAHEYAGMSLGEADLLRVGVSKKKAEIILKSRELFFSSSLKAKRNPKTTEEIFSYIEQFANYGFNKSHAIAYAMVSYFMAYLKVHHYKEFMAVMMSHNLGSSSFEYYLKECKKKGLTLKNPDINISTLNFEIKDNEIYFPLVAIKQMGVVLANQILEARKMLFKTLEEFISKTDIAEGVFENLVFASALDTFGYNKKTMISNFSSIKNALKFNKYLENSIEFKITKEEEYSVDFLREKERELLGFNIKYEQTLDLNSYRIKHNISGLNKSERFVKNVFVMTSVKIITTKKNEKMAICELSDEIGSQKGVIFPREFKLISSELKPNNIYLVNGELKSQDGQLEIIVKNLENITTL